MEFSSSDQLETECSAVTMEGSSHGPLPVSVTMATVTISPQQMQTIEGSTKVHLEDDKTGGNQVMNMYLTSEGSAELLTEQEGIRIIQEGGSLQSDLLIGEEGVVEGRVLNTPPPPCADNQEDTTSLFAKLQANNAPKTNFVQLTFDGKIIKQQRDTVAGDTPESSGTGGVVTTPVLNAAHGLLQQITLQDGSTAYVPHPSTAGAHQVELEDGTVVLPVITEKGSLQAVRLEDGTVGYIPAELLQQGSAITATVSLNLDPNSKHELEQKPLVKASADVEETIDSFLEGESDKIIQVTVPSTNSSSSSGKTIREQLAETYPDSYTSMTDLVKGIYKCTHQGCKKIFTSAHHLKIHERTHSGDKPYVCEHMTCQKAFATAYGKKSHMRTHTGEKPYRCSHEGCTKAFKTSGDLQKHTRTHTGEKPFACPFEGCNKSFTTSNIRKVHIRVHTGERPYECPAPECGKKFSSATNYRNHVRIHTGERPYVCMVPGCGKRFTEYSSLYKHHVVHTHTKPYLCGHCGKTYRQTSTLAQHKRQVHNDMSPVADMDVALHPLPDPQANYQPETESGEGALVIHTGEPQPTTSPQSVTEEASSSVANEAEVNPAQFNIVIPQEGAGNAPLFIIKTELGQTQILQQIASQPMAKFQPAKSGKQESAS